MSKKVKVAICTHSVSSLFVVGESYEFESVGKLFKFQTNSPLYTVPLICLVDGDEITVPGSARTLATFNTGQAKKTKSHRKMLVRAFVKIAKERGWGDSKNGAFKTWSGNIYNGAKDWARAWADSYCDESGDVAKEHLTYFGGEDFVIDQAFFDLFAEEEIDAL